MSEDIVLSNDIISSYLTPMIEELGIKRTESKRIWYKPSPWSARVRESRHDASACIDKRIAFFKSSIPIWAPSISSKTRHANRWTYKLYKEGKSRSSLDKRQKTWVILLLCKTNRYSPSSMRIISLGSIDHQPKIPMYLFFLVVSKTGRSLACSD